MNIVHVECCSSSFWLLGLAFSAKCLILLPYYVRGFLLFFYNPPLRKPVGAQRLLNLIRIWKIWDTVTKHIWGAKWIHPNNAPSVPFQSGLIRWSWTASLIPRTCTEIRVCLNSRWAFIIPPSSGWNLSVCVPSCSPRSPSVHFSNNNDRVGGPVAATNKERVPAGDPTVTFISKSWNPDSRLIVITRGLCFFPLLLIPVCFRGNFPRTCEYFTITSRHSRHRQYS